MPKSQILRMLLPNFRNSGEDGHENPKKKTHKRITINIKSVFIASRKVK